MRTVYVVTAATVVIAGLAFYQFGVSHKRQAGGGAAAAETEVPADRLVPLGRIDHTAWDRLLKKYVDGHGMVDYAAWKASQADRDALGKYLTELARGGPEAETAQSGKLAFWINAYNAVTVQGILQEYPTSSIRNHTAKALGYNIWDDLLLRVGGKDYSLNHIEHKILRKLDEPRIHFAIVCASIGCPPLRNEAYTPGRIEIQLADNARTFFSRPKHFQADVSRRTAQVSPILKWFGEDFGPTPQAGLTRLIDYIADGAPRRMIAAGDFSVEYLDYDWDLNEQ